jgi:hypothetical protein
MTSEINLLIITIINDIKIIYLIEIICYIIYTFISEKI